jgi:hypothetical protein
MKVPVQSVSAQASAGKLNRTACVCVAVSSSVGNLRQIEKVASFRESWYFNLSADLLP